MSILATKIAPASYWSETPELPEEAPLAMPRQRLDGEGPDLAPAPSTSPPGIVGRRLTLLAATLALTGLMAWGPWLLYAREGFQPLEVVGFSLFLVLAACICTWFCSASAGLWVLVTGREQQDLAFSARPAAPRTRTALLMPLYNEDAAAAFGRLQALDAALGRLGVADAFDIFVLSDTRSEEIAAAERAAYWDFSAQANTRVYLRRRATNVERKAGNVGDWVRRFGGAYDFMIVLDADSSMAGETVLRLVDAMERHPDVGLIQTTPTIVGARTLFAWGCQFGVQMYGRVAAAGLAWWTGAESSYWGHNAIVRVKAFAAAAGLPILPGERPFGGHILSHDVVEAALLRRAGWGVHLTAALDGSCEQTPPNIIEFMRRDNRWCQGNLQHLRLLKARGLHPISRLQLVLGCLAYLCSPLWLAALTLGLASQLGNPVDWASFFYFLDPRFSPFMLTSLLSVVLLMGPKLMGAALVLSRPHERRAFGGGAAVIKSLGAEILLSAALAPVLMVANTRSVLQTLRGRDVGWGVQRRDGAGLDWSEALQATRWHAIVGAGFVAGLCIRPDLSVAFAPVVLPLLLAPVLAVMSSRRLTARELASFAVMREPVEVAAMPALVVAGPGARAMRSVHPFDFPADADLAVSPAPSAGS
ncbi:glucans biosynthesis glucosyltransferase MdoH [Phenylobacterium sp.]|uniref:glucans biosynthesis glucosyltransferase MdoH n=1 Tax=Phenylobacterium sp. TaxID=1871053 RepID=UPI002E33FC53|nr:glucans biosynthesis glucosyltransferase MdoH [Phenylobacterium sp.]HEX2559943.1 glucans biosynthesis glucosyltransferase MdoH [Phenylobacterium sp.]